MAYSVEMPALGESVTEGTVTRWLKQEGDSVQRDEPLLEVSTDKVDTEIPSPAAGVLQRILVPEDETVEVGAELAVIGDEAGPDSGGEATGVGTGSEEADRDSADRDRGDVVVEERTGDLDQPAEQPSEQRGFTAASWSRSGSSSGGGSGSGTPVEMPALGESVTEGTVTRWLKHVGDTVEVDEPLLEVSTDKVDTEIPSPVAGTLLEIKVNEDETAAVGAPLAVVGSGDAGGPEAVPPAQAEPTPGQHLPEQAAERGPSAEAPQQRAQQAQQPEARPEPDIRPEPSPQTAQASPPDARQQPPATEPPAREPAQAQAGWAEPAPAGNGAASTSAPYVTPLVRKLAADHGIDLSSVRGTGVGGRIRKQDVMAAVEDSERAAVPAQEPPGEQAPTTAAAVPAETPAASALRGRTEKMSRLRKVIARRMVESLQVSAQLTTVTEVDLSRVARLRERARREFEAREGVRLTFLPFCAKAAVDALKQHPKLNASLDEEAGEVTYHGAEHLGIAVDTERGLLVPVIKDAGDLNIAGLARKIADLAERTRSSRITPDELSGGTFTLTNIGSRGALLDTPIINQPQVGILGTGAVVKRPVVVSDNDEDSIAIRAMMYLVLTYDHRLVDGADAARFLQTVRRRLEEGAFEADLGL